FMIVDVVGLYYFAGGEAGISQFIRSLVSGLANFILIPVPLFILMGEVLLCSGLANDIIKVIDKWFGRLPGRLALLTVGVGTLFSALCGMSTATVSMMGRVLIPEMEKRGYKKQMSLGSILGSGGLSIMIPPSALAVLLAAVGEISVGQILIAIIVPGFLMAALYTLYIILRCKLQPSIAPPYFVEKTSLRERISESIPYIAPIILIVFMVVGVILLGIATPSEASATGALGTFILTAIHRRFSWALVKESFSSTAKITIQLFLIVVCAGAFSQLLAFTGSTTGVVNLAVNSTLPPLWIVISMMVAALILGMFMTVAAVMMITLPIFVPVVTVLGFDPVWFGVLMMLNLEIGVTSPPFGVNLFAMKMVAPPGTTMGDCYRASLPFIGLDLIAMVLIIVFPSIALWLPGLMR
ncbi:TRAP transporter large permease subunit, partial [Thermodesulfobacteriota bacterium]